MNQSTQTVKVMSLLSNTQKTADAWTKYIDLAGYGCCTIVVEANMTTADATNYFTPILKEATASPAATGSYTSVAAADYTGSTFAAIVATGVAVAQQITYVGSSRYLAVLLDETLTADGVFTVTAYLSNPKSTASFTPTTGAVS